MSIVRAEMHVVQCVTGPSRIPHAASCASSWRNSRRARTLAVQRWKKLLLRTSCTSRSGMWLVRPIQRMSEVSPRYHAIGKKRQMPGVRGPHPRRPFRGGSQSAIKRLSDALHRRDYSPEHYSSRNSNLPLCSAIGTTNRFKGTLWHRARLRWGLDGIRWVEYSGRGVS
jgi:hypothetical protein